MQLLQNAKSKADGEFSTPHKDLSHRVQMARILGTERFRCPNKEKVETKFRKLKIHFSYAWQWLISCSETVNVLVTIEQHVIYSFHKFGIFPVQAHNVLVHCLVVEVLREFDSAFQENIWHPVFIKSMCFDVIRVDFFNSKGLEQDIPGWPRLTIAQINCWVIHQVGETHFLFCCKPWQNRNVWKRQLIFMFLRNYARLPPVVKFFLSIVS